MSQPVIDHDPDETPGKKRKPEGYIESAQKRDPWLPITLLWIMTAITWPRYNIKIEFSADFMMLCAFMLLMHWLLWPKKR